MTRVVTQVSGSVKEVLQHVIARGLSPEETLRRLDSYGIDWYITGQGTLVYRYWQVAAEDFVSPEHVATLRIGREVPAESDALEWVSRNLPQLRVRYAGQWIAVSGNQVVAHARSLPELMQRLEEAAIERPFVTEIPAEPVVWATAYAE